MASMADDPRTGASPAHPSYMPSVFRRPRTQAVLAARRVLACACAPIPAQNRIALGARRASSGLAPARRMGTAAVRDAIASEAPRPRPGPGPRDPSTPGPRRARQPTASPAASRIRPIRGHDVHGLTPAAALQHSWRLLRASHESRAASRVTPAMATLVCGSRRAGRAPHASGRRERRHAAAQPAQPVTSVLAGHGWPQPVPSDPASTTLSPASSVPPSVGPFSRALSRLPALMWVMWVPAPASGMLALCSAFSRPHCAHWVHWADWGMCAQRAQSSGSARCRDLGGAPSVRVASRSTGHWPATGSTGSTACCMHACVLGDLGGAGGRLTSGVWRLAASCRARRMIGRWDGASTVRWDGVRVQISTRDASSWNSWTGRRKRWFRLHSHPLLLVIRRRRRRRRRLAGCASGIRELGDRERRMAPRLAHTTRSDDAGGSAGFLHDRNSKRGPRNAGQRGVRHAAAASCTVTRKPAART